VAPIDKELIQHRLRWFGHIQEWNSKEYGKYKEGPRTTKVNMGGGDKKTLKGLECPNRFVSLIGPFGNQRSMCQNLSSIVLFSLSLFWFPYVSVRFHI
jgi:hypothetical protein